MSALVATTPVTYAPPAPADFDTIADDLAALKRDFTRLMEQMKTGAVDGTSETAQNRYHPATGVEWPLIV